MPELMRHIAARLREWVGNRRYAARHEVRVPVTVQLENLNAAGVTGTNRANNQRAVAPLAGHTRDVSATGLALILPAVRIGEHYLTNQNNTLLVTLELADNQVLALRVAPVRYEQLEAEEAERGYLIGVRLLEASDQARFDAFLRTLETRK